MQELIYAGLYLGILVGLLALIVVIARYYHAAQPRAPDQKAPAPSEAALETPAVPQFEPVLITFIVDTPWGNAGETLPGALTRMENGQQVLSIDDETGTSFTIAQGEPYVHIQEVRTSDSSG
jgi:hypothetical protein